MSGPPVAAVVNPSPTNSLPHPIVIISSSASIQRMLGATNARPAATEPASDEDEDERDERLSQKWSCQTIRGKINRFLATKEMTQTAFLKEISANSNSFQRFMKLKGPFGGSQNSTYWGALHFFDEREKEAKKAKASGTNKRKKSSKDDDEESPATKKKKFAERLKEIDAVVLPENLKVYDDCDVVRGHIQEFLLTKVMPQTEFAKYLNVSLAALHKYLARKGKREGVGIVYKAAYYFFEKKRILEGVPKTAKRKKIEETMPQGYSLERDPTHCWVYVGKDR
ncbi:hypothetical protein LEN26_017123 [Aphanomyces euteiches]|nr:hypothetical protein LEN26_017123 [Aphanomyces euteiches]KAH9128248.1 hypothetical protein AeMF1_001573 [Aphanomyces euteiches]